MEEQNELITIAEAAKCLGVNPQSLRNQIKADPAKLGFPAGMVGCHAIIPRKPFYRFLRGE